VLGQQTVGSQLESHGSEYEGLAYRSHVDELGAVAAHHAVNQPENQPDLWDFQPRSNTQAVSNHHRLEAGSFSSAQSGITSISYQPVLSDAFPDPASVEYVSTPSWKSSGRFPTAEYVQRYNTSATFDLPPNILAQDFSGEDHLTSRLNGSAMAFSLSPWLGQAEHKNSVVSADMPNTFRQTSDGAQPFFNSLSNTNSPFSHVATKGTADWEDDTNNVGLLPCITSPSLTQIPDIETQIHPPHDVDLYRCDHGAPQMEMPESVPGVPFLVFDKPKYDSEDPYTRFLSRTAGQELLIDTTGLTSKYLWLRYQSWGTQTMRVMEAIFEAIQLLYAPDLAAH
jgi:hypothetical protein